jgi:rare lipoprotein A
MDGMAKLTRFAIRLTLTGVLLGVCGHAQEQAAAHAVEEGLASWYGADFDGLRAASGEIFDSGQFTAAHRTLPFGTKVRVRRLDSAESIVVRINDRGPFVNSRIIDLSYAAAERLGVTDPGLFRVALEVLEGAPVSPQIQAFFAVQVGTFRYPENARRTQALMQQKFGDSSIQRSGEFWRVVVGNAATQAGAETLAAAVRASARAFQSAYVVSVGR